MSYEKIFDDLEAGIVRSAKKVGGRWIANTEVKSAILDAFKDGKLIKEGFFVDKHNLFPQSFSVDRGIRLVPGGSSVRRGSFVAKGVIIMPPSYINVGAYVGEGTMVDSHALVGSCAQIGKRVHLSAGVQIGGVLEPIGESPVVIEDDCFIGAGAVIVEGVQVLEKAVIAPNVTLSKSIPVYDLVNERMLEKNEPIPSRAVVVSGNRPLNNEWGRTQGLSAYCALIIKYRDEKSDASLTLEDLLR